MDEKQEAFRGQLQMHHSLIDAVREAGGCYGDRFLSMTVQELIEELGPNGVRLEYKEPRPSDGRPDPV